MKLWSTLATAGLVAGSAFAGAPTVQDEPNKWMINVGFAIPDGDLKDLGVDSMFSIGADWMLGSNNASGSETFIGVLGMFGSGDASLDCTVYGIHYGVIFGLGAQGGGMDNFQVKLQGGFYNNKLSDDFDSEDDWGFGGLAALQFAPPNSGFRIALGYFFMPEVADVDNRGWTITVSIPVK